MIAYLVRIALIPVLASVLTAQESISIYLEPSTTGTVYYKEDLSNLNKLSPKPFPPNVPKTAWMTVLYPGAYVGYVQPSDISEDMKVKPGTPIRVRPFADGRIMTVVDEGISPQVIEMGPNWCTVHYVGDATAYFEWPSEQPVTTGPEMITVTSATATPAEGGEIVAVAEAEEVIAPTASRAPTSTGASTMAVTPAPARQSSPPPASAAASAPGKASAPPELAPIQATPRPSAPVYAPPVPPPTSQQITRFWEGKLVRNKGLNKLFGKNYPYYLENAAGERIAYVDLSEALLFQPVEKYWDSQVIINGTSEDIVDTSPVLIKVRMIRPKY